MQPLKLWIAVLVALLLLTAFGRAQDQSAASARSEDYSGMYTFLREGEFVQVTVEEQGRVNGYISRYGDLDSDKGAFLDQFFKQGKLEGHALNFTTQTVHGIWYEFKGAIERGEGKNPGEEAYYVLKGTLTQYATDATKKVTAKTREVIFKEFPQDAGAEQDKKD